MKRPRRRRSAQRKSGPIAVRVAQIEAVQRELDKLTPQRGGKASARGRWNPDPEEVQRSVAKLVLTLVEFLRKLMERQAIRRMEEETLSPAELEAVGTALMTLEDTLLELARRFDLEPEDLNLDLGPLKLL